MIRTEEDRRHVAALRALSDDLPVGVVVFRLRW
jgi:hypothetical protein